MSGAAPDAPVAAPSEAAAEPHTGGTGGSRVFGDEPAPKRQCAPDRRPPVKQSGVPIGSAAPSQHAFGRAAELAAEEEPAGAVPGSSGASGVGAAAARKLRGNRTPPVAESGAMSPPACSVSDSKPRSGVGVTPPPWGACPVCGARFPLDGTLDRHVQAELELIEAEEAGEAYPSRVPDRALNPERPAISRRRPAPTQPAIRAAGTAGRGGSEVMGQRGGSDGGRGRAGGRSRVRQRPHCGKVRPS